MNANKKDMKAAYAELQHRHFATIARIIRNIPDAGYRADTAQHFADELAHTNAKFDRNRFLAACQAS